MNLDNKILLGYLIKGIIIFVVIILIYQIFFQPSKEKMGNLEYDITRNTSKFLKNINNETIKLGNNPNFLLQKDRFLLNQSSNIKNNQNCGQICSNYKDDSCNLNGKPIKTCLSDNKFDNIDWSIKYEPGANGTVSDLSWNYMSPRMTLRCGCLKCGVNDSAKVYNAPSGFPDGYINSDRGRNIEYLDKAIYANPDSFGSDVPF